MFLSSGLVGQRGLCMLGLFETADEDIMILLNVGNCIPVDREY